MPDITMCTNKNCYNKNRCGRYTEKITKHQSCAKFTSTNCQFYMTNEQHVFITERPDQKNNIS